MKERIPWGFEYYICLGYQFIGYLTCMKMASIHRVRLRVSGAVLIWIFADDLQMIASFRAVATTALGALALALILRW